MHAPASAAIFYHKALQVCPPLLALVQAGRGGQVKPLVSVGVQLSLGTGLFFTAKYLI